MKPTQKDRLRALFKNRPNTWISLTEILDLHIAQYNSRVLDLRRSGMVIENMTKFDKERGMQLSWFRWLPKALEYKEQEEFNYADSKSIPA